MLTESYCIVHDMKECHKGQLLCLFKNHLWLKDRTIEYIEIIEKTCIVFSLIEKKNDALVGFARVLTDDVKHAYVHDLIVKEELQGQGLGRYLMEAILSHPRLKPIICFELTCYPEKVAFYKKFKFKEDYGTVCPLKYDKRLESI